MTMISDVQQSEFLAEGFKVRLSCLSPELLVLHQVQGQLIWPCSDCLVLALKATDRIWDFGGGSYISVDFTFAPAAALVADALTLDLRAT